MHEKYAFSRCGYYILVPDEVSDTLCMNHAPFISQYSFHHLSIFALVSFPLWGLMELHFDPLVSLSCISGPGEKLMMLDKLPS